MARRISSGLGWTVAALHRSEGPAAEETAGDNLVGSTRSFVIQQTVKRVTCVKYAHIAGLHSTLRRNSALDGSRSLRRRLQELMGAER